MPDSVSSGDAVAQQSTPQQPTPRVTLIGRVGCHLCEQAREIIEHVCDELGEAFTEVDIDSDPALVERYGAEIPVTLVDGRQHDFWRVSEDRLRAALTG
jgi:Glutaredoxin-like domain (DUF836)